MVGLRVALRLRFIKIPGIQDVRLFRDVLMIENPEERSYQDISDIIEKKLRFMEIPPCDFTVFFNEKDGGDRVVVDDGYFREMIENVMREADLRRGKLCRQESSPSPDGAQRDFNMLSALSDLCESSETKRDIFSRCYEDGETEYENVEMAFEIEVNKLRSAAPSTRITIPGMSPVNLRDLDSNCLRSLETSGMLPVKCSEVCIPIGQLKAPLSVSSFYIRGVVISIRVKTPKPGLCVTEIDMCDMNDPKQQITAVTFDAEVQRSVKSTLRDDRRQVIEMRKIHVRVKSDSERRFEANPHPLLIRFDKGSKIEVVQLLTLPLPPAPSNQVVTIRENLQSSGVVSVMDLAALNPSKSHLLSLGLLSSSSSSPSLLSTQSLSQNSNSGFKKTTVTFVGSAGSGSVSASSASIAGAVPSRFGEFLRAQQVQFVTSTPKDEDRAELSALEPGVEHVTLRDVRRRERIVDEHASKEDMRKDRIRRRVELSTRCILCGLDASNESYTMEIVSKMLRANHRNLGKHIPTFAELIAALSDNRRVPAGKKSTRLVCQAQFVNTVRRTLHVVHCRCAHLCTDYQRGTSLEDIVLYDLDTQLCSLCGMSGAFVKCYHPDCSEIYHSVCALFSMRYVNFGQRDPHLPCPACPRHTQVVLSTNKKQTPSVMHVDNSCWDDGIAFDSRVVDATDLRDPDENDGE